MAVTVSVLKNPREEGGTPPSRLHPTLGHPTAASSLVGAKAGSLPVRVPGPLRRRSASPTDAADSENLGSHEEDYFMAKSLKMYNRLLAAGLQVSDIVPCPPA
jgi:hypothetical protein